MSDTASATVALEPETVPAPAAPPRRSAAGRVLAFLGSFGLAIVILSFLLLLTFLGTLAQAQSSLYEVQRRYFESLFVVHTVLGVPVPLPGVYLLLVALSVNLVVGGMIRIRKSAATVGVLVTHVGVLMMLAGGLVEYHASTKGHMTLPEGAASDEVESFFEWEITVAEAGSSSERVLPGERWIHLRRDATARFTSGDWPFDLDVGNVARNSEVRPAEARRDGEPVAMGGLFLRTLPLDKEAERDVAGCYVRLAPKDGASPTEGILHGDQAAPLSVTVAGKTWLVDLHKRRWQVPFTIRLTDFRRELHPGTTMAASFESDVVKVEGGAEQPVRISMNRPLRHAGYTFFQSGFRELGGGRFQSTFSVVRNPADAVPLYACLVMAAGLVLHFLRKLIRHVRDTAGRRAAS